MPIKASVPPLPFRHRTEQGYFDIPWQRFFLDLQADLAGNVAPADARYVVGSPDGSLPNAINLGALATGWLRITTTLGSAVAASSPVVYQDLEPVVDITIPANMGAIVPDRFVLAAGRVLTIGAGAVFQIT